MSFILAGSRNPQTTARAISVLTVLVSTLILLGWVRDGELLKGLASGAVSLKPIAAVGFLLLGLASWPVADIGVAATLGRLCASGVMAIGLAVLGGYGWRRDFGIDADAGTVALPGSVLVMTAVNFVLLSGAFLVAKSKSEWILSGASAGCVFVFATSMLALLGFLAPNSVPNGSPLVLLAAALLFMGLAESALIRLGHSIKLASDCVFAVLVVAAGYLIRSMLEALVGPGIPPFITFFPMIMIVSLLAGFWPGLFSTAYAFAVVDFWIFNPEGSFALGTLVQYASAVVFVIMGIFTSVVAERYRRKLREVADYEGRQALLESDERYRSLFEASLDAIFSLGPDGRFVTANPSALNITGRTLEEIKQIHFLDLCAPDQREAAASAFRAAFCRQCLTLESALIAKDGTRREIFISGAPAVVDGTVVGVSCIARDVTERKHVQEEFQAELERRVKERTEDLRQSEERLRHFINSVKDYSITLMDPQGHLVSWNEGARRMHGYEAEEILGQYFGKFHTPEDIAQGKPGWELRKAVAEGHVDDQGWRLRKDGSRFMADVIITAIKGGQGELCGFTKVTRDITHFMEVEQALREQNAKAEAASVAKSQFLANMSHEIRTPMNAVMGFPQLLHHTSLDERQRDYVDKARTAANTLLDLLNDILDFSKVEAGKLELEQMAFNLYDLLHDLSVVLSVVVKEKDIEVLFEMEGEFPHAVVGDALRLKQVLLNITNNAIKFTQHGHVLLGLRLVESTADHVSIEFSVTDTGIGIDPDKLAMIFEGFTQAEASTTRRFGGTGLGLAISRRLVGLMDGEIFAESSPGSGSRFYFVLDLPRAETPNESNPLRRLETGSVLSLQTPLRVLIVDDNEVAREILCRMGESIGWQVEALRSGVDAVARLDAAPGEQSPYDAIFLDWKMPGLDGWETALRIRRISFLGRTPMVVLVTAYGRELLRRNLSHSESPFDGVLMKPVTPSMLLDAVVEALGGNALKQRGNSRSPSPPGLVGMRVLIAEDNPTNQQVAQELLESQGAIVVTANDGAEAIQHIAGAAVPFDAVLMDLQMPVMDGYEAVRLLRGRYGLVDLPIVAMTANVMAADVTACLAAGMNDHVGKPFDLATVVAKLSPYRPKARTDILDAVPAGLENHDYPGFDIEGALNRFNHQYDLYLRVVNSYQQDQALLRLRLKDALAEQNMGKVATELHTLKGLAATVGATALAELASQAEKLAKAGDRGLADLCEPLENKLEDALKVLDSFVEHCKTLPPFAILSSNKDAILILLDTLEPLLKTSNLRALQCLDDLQKHYGAELGPALSPLADAINRMDFQVALRESQRLRDSIN